MSINGPRLGSKNGKIAFMLSRALVAGEKVKVQVSFADLQNEDRLFVFYQESHDAGDFDADHSLALVTVQDTRAGWSISYSEHGFCRIRLDLIEAPADIEATVVFKAYLHSDLDADTINSGPVSLKPGEHTSWVLGK
jgi:hypothetical protein